MKHFITLSVLLGLLASQAVQAMERCPSWLNIKTLKLAPLITARCEPWKATQGKTYWVVLQDPYDFYNQDAVKFDEGAETPAVKISVYSSEISKEVPVFSEGGLGDYLVEHKLNGKKLKTSQVDLNHDGTTEFLFVTHGTPTDLMAGLRVVTDKKTQTSRIERLTFAEGPAAKEDNLIPTVAGVPIEIEGDKITVVLESTPRKIRQYHVKAN